VADLSCSAASRRGSPRALEEAEPPPGSRLAAYLVGIVIVVEIGFLVIEKFPMLLGLEAAAVLVAGIIRWHTAVRQSKAREPVA
jgi:hypothetical protein